MPDLKNVADVLAQPRSWLEQQDAWGNSALRWLIVLAAVLAGVLVLKVVRGLLIRHTSRLYLPEKGAGDWFRGVEDLLRRTKTWFLAALAAYLGSGFLALPPGLVQDVAAGMIVALLLQAALWANALLGFAVARSADGRKEADPASATTLGALVFLGRLAIWTTAVLLVMANLGINVTALVAGLGIGGVAVALAAQNILGDLFASASIVLDKPFVLGDFIVVDDKTGTVEHIGLKTTRLRSLSGEQLVFSNTDLLKSRIHNYQRMSERRAAFAINVAYGTPYEKLAAIPAMLREAVQSQPQARFDRAHFTRFGPPALAFEVVYYVTGADYNVYMDVQQAINLAIVRRFAQEGVEFAR
jgi:small-conductance mechanosensitive channel